MADRSSYVTKVGISDPFGRGLPFMRTLRVAGRFSRGCRLRVR
jgi:hypothetical protein